MPAKTDATRKNLTAPLSFQILNARIKINVAIKETVSVFSHAFLKLNLRRKSTLKQSAMPGKKRGTLLQ
jgi:hypothetical protein